MFLHIVLQLLCSRVLMHLPTDRSRPTLTGSTQVPDFVEQEQEAKFDAAWAAHAAKQPATVHHLNRCLELKQ